MRDEIWYREELIALNAVVEDAIRRSSVTDVERMTVLGHLHLKLSEAIKTAPSATTAEASA